MVPNARYCDETTEGLLPSDIRTSSALHLVSARAEYATDSVLLWLHRVPLAGSIGARDGVDGRVGARQCVHSLRDLVGSHVRRAALMSLDGVRERKLVDIDAPLAIPLGHIVAFRVGW